MAKVNRKETEKIRNTFVTNALAEYLKNGEDCFQIATNKICMPVVGEEGGEYFITVTFAIPTGERNGEPFDGYAEKETFELKVKDKTEKAKAKAEKKKGK